jgi:hypothetical protein
MAKNDSIPMDFKRFVHGIEINEHCYIKLTFNSAEELKRSASYYFDRAVLKPDLAPKFAEYAAKIYFVGPEKEDINFRKALIAESQRQLDVFLERLNSASNPMTLEHAVGVITFYGELFNVGFIFKGIVKKYAEILEMSKSDCLISNRCYYALMNSVKKRVLIMADDDYGVVIQALVKKIEETERNGQVLPETNKPPEVSKTFEELFPPLSDSPPLKGSDSSEMTFDQKIDLFKFLLEDLQANNSSTILKRINESKKIKFDEDTWEVFYEIMIEHGISNPTLAEAIVDLCLKIPRAWQGVKMEDCKGFIIQMISLKIKKLFETKTTQIEIFGVLNLLQKLMEQSFYSIGSIANTVDVVLTCSQHDMYMAARILIQFFAITKKYVNSKKIQKLPEKVRKQVLQVMKTAQNGKMSPKAQHTLKELEEYMAVEHQEEPGTSKSFNEPLITNGKEFRESPPVNGHRLNFDPVIGRRTPDIKANAFMR